MISNYYIDESEIQLTARDFKKNYIELCNLLHTKLISNDMNEAMYLKAKENNRNIIIDNFYSLDSILNDYITIKLNSDNLEKMIKLYSNRIQSETNYLKFSDNQGDIENSILVMNSIYKKFTKYLDSIKKKIVLNYENNNFEFEMELEVELNSI